MKISQLQHILNWAMRINLSNTKRENEGQGHRPSVFDLGTRCTPVALAEVHLITILQMQVYFSGHHLKNYLTDSMNSCPLPEQPACTLVNWLNKFPTDLLDAGWLG